LWLGTGRTSAAFLAQALCPLAQFGARTLANVDAADRGDADGLALYKRDTEPTGQVVCRAKSACRFCLRDEVDGLAFGHPEAAHAGSGIDQRADAVGRLGKMPQPRDQPPGKVLGVGSAYVFGVRLDLAAASHLDVEMVAPPDHAFALASQMEHWDLPHDATPRGHCAPTKRLRNHPGPGSPIA
jgi:hypothetical protein